MMHQPTQEEITMSQRQPPPPVPGWRQPAPPPNAKKPIWQRWWVIAIVAVLLIGGIAQAFGGNEQPTAIPAASAAPTSPPPVPTPSVAAASASPSASPTPDPDVQAAKIAKAVDKALKEELGVKKSYVEMCGKVNWACAISEIRAGANPGYVEVYVQEDLTKAEAKQIALYVFNLTGLEVKDVDWVIVYDSSQSVAGQMYRGNVPLLNR